MLNSHKRKIGVVLLKCMILVLFCVPTTVAFAENKKCPEPSDSYKPNIEEIAKNAFTLKLELDSSKSDDHYYVVTMKPNFSKKSDPEKYERYCQQTFTLTVVNGGEPNIIAPSKDAILRCDHPLHIYVKDLDAADTFYGLPGASIHLRAENVGKLDPIFKPDGHPCYYDKVDVDMEKTVVKPDSVVTANCPSVDAEKYKLFSEIKCDGATGFLKSFCDMKAKALATPGANYSTEIQGNKGSMKSTKTFQCEDDLNNSTKVPYNMDTLDGDAYFVNKSYLFAAYEDKDISFGFYEYEYTPGDKPATEPITCDIKCEEAVEVEYGPPVASKAGACFEYKVRVTSRVVCGMTKAPDMPQSNCNYCNPIPTCWGYGRYWDQGGPNEEYDSCVQSCDGGKYSKKCSEKCYEEVYGETDDSGLKVNNYAPFELTSSRLATRNLLLECINIEGKSNPNGCYFKTSAYYVNEKVATFAWRGSEDWSSLDTSKTRPDCKCDSEDRAACANKCAGIEGRWYTSRPYGKYHNGEYKLPAANHDGFWRKMYGSGYCTDVCGWQDCRTTANGIKYVNDGYAQRDYKKNMEKRNEAIRACKTRATCRTTQSEYTISADYINGEGKSVTVVFPQNGKPDTIKYNNKGSVSSTKDSDYTTLLPDYPTSNFGLGGCYNSSYDNPNETMYRSTWGFAASWKNRKTGELTYTPPTGGDASGWEKMPDKFCLPDDAKKINFKWYDLYYQRYLRIHGLTFDDLAGSDYQRLCLNRIITTKWEKVEKIDYNIVASTRKFGHFAWNLDIKCFYAWDNETGKPIDKTIPAEKCEDDPGYDIRTIDLKNMFPSETGKGGKSSTEKTRARGYNWTKEAYISNTRNKDYPSDPDNYVKMIQKAAATRDYYSEDKLDYEFTITASELRQIRQAGKVGSVYGDFKNSGFSLDKNGLARYKSDLIRSSAIKDKKVPAKSSAALLCNNMVRWNSTQCCYITDGTNCDGYGH